MTHGVCALGTHTAEGFRLDDRDGFHAAIRRMPFGRVRLSAEMVGEKRSLDQNAYLHATPFPMIASHIGDSVEGVKYDLMGEKWGWKPSPLNPDRMVPVKPSTSSMTVAECSEFIEWVIPFALQTFGLSIPYPNKEAA